MKINVVLHGVCIRIDECQFDIIVLMHNQERTRNRALKRHGLKRRTLVVNDNRFFLYRQGEFHDLRTGGRRLLMRVHERWSDKRQLLARKGIDVFVRC